MLNHVRRLRAFVADRRAVTALEYGIIAGWLAVVIITAFVQMGNSIRPLFVSVGSSI